MFHFSNEYRGAPLLWELSAGEKQVVCGFSDA